MHYVCEQYGNGPIVLIFSQFVLYEIMLSSSSTVLVLAVGMKPANSSVDLKGREFALLTGSRVFTIRPDHEHSKRA